MDRQKHKIKRATRRANHVRRGVRGTTERPRLTVFRSNMHIYVQIINDLEGKTLASAGTAGEASKIKYGGNVKAAEAIGTLIAEKAKAAGVTKVAFDRGSYKFHGRVKALAEAARKGGLQF